jgi:multidrug efflux pump subunit AcrB
VTLRFGGQYEQQQASFRALAWVLLGGLALVALVALFVTGDGRAALATVGVSLASLAGSMAALWATGMTLDVSSYVGAIMMTGIAAENSLFLVREAQLAIASGVEVQAAWAAASRRRLRPVAMTVLAGASALAPLALAVGEGSQLMQPLAIAVIGGFVLSGPLVLWVLPALAARRPDDRPASETGVETDPPALPSP